MSANKMVAVISGTVVSKVDFILGLLLVQNTMKPHAGSN